MAVPAMRLRSVPLLLWWEHPRDGSATHGRDGHATAIAASGELR